MKGKLLTFLVGSILIIYLGVSFAHQYKNSSKGGDQSFVADFERVGMGAWVDHGYVQACCNDSISLVAAPVKKGNRSARFLLRRDDPDVHDSRRAEVRMTSAKIGSEHWQAFSTYLPEDWEVEEAPVTVAQWHAVPDKFIGEAGRPPPLRLLVIGDTWQVARIWDENKLSAVPMQEFLPTGYELIELQKIVPGEWVEWVFHLVWHYDGSGLTEIWRNGDLVVRREGPNAYNDRLAPYLKLGLYIPEWAKAQPNSELHRREIFLDEVFVLNRHGLSTLTEVTNAFREMSASMSDANPRAVQ